MSNFYSTPKKDSFGHYLKSIGRYDVLTREQEVELARDVQEMMRYIHLSEAYESLEEKLAACDCSLQEYRRVMYKGSRAKEKMIVHNLKLVVCIAKKYNNRGVDIEDLVQEGNIGLNRAVEKFNPELGFKLSTYACVPTTTKILTRRGWLKWDEINAGDYTIGYDTEKNEVAWTKLEAVTHYENASLLRFGQERWSTLCTPNHSWLMEDDQSISLTPIENWHKDTDKNLILSAFFKGGNSTITEDEARLLAWIYTEEEKIWSNRAYLDGVYVCPGSAALAKDIKELLIKLCLEENRKEDGKEQYWIPGSLIRNIWRKGNLYKQTLFSLIFELSPEARKAFNETCHKIYGKSKHQSVINSNRKDVEVLELSMFLDGANCLRGIRKNNKGVITWDDNQISNGESEVKKVGRGDVWCPSTTLGSWVAQDIDGNIFITGNTWWVKQSISRAVATHSRQIRLPVHIYDLLNKIKRAARELSQINNRQATLKEIADYLEVSYEKLVKLSVFTKNVMSLDTTCVESESSSVLNEYNNYIAKAEVKEKEREIQQKILFILDKLSHRDRQVVIMRYGLNTDKPATYKCIAEQLDLTVPIVRSICNGLKERFIELAAIDPEEYLDAHTDITTDTLLFV